MGISSAYMYRRVFRVCRRWKRVIGANVYWRIVWIAWICGRVISASRCWIIVGSSDGVGSWGQKFPVDCWKMCESDASFFVSIVMVVSHNSPGHFMPWQLPWFCAIEVSGNARD